MTDVENQPGAPANGNGHHAAASGTVEGASSMKSHNLASRPSSMDDGVSALKVVYKNLSWTVEIPNTDPATKKARPTVSKKVLDNVSGVFRPGKFTAVMGSSGAGKTTLLNVIAGYGYGGKTTGDVLVNGEKIGQTFMRDISGFVHQHDIILETMTVREAVRMAAHLRLPRGMSTIEKDNRVEEVLRWLNLVKIADNQIGSPEKKGISGGERRRVSVAMEMVRNPGILYLDEPTSGLDSFTAYAVAHLLQTVAHQHSRTIVATIHQPSSEIFALFDDLVLLNLGKVIYHGPAADAMRYFDINLGYRIPRYTNPSDFIFMRILNGGGAKDVIGAKLLRSTSPPIVHGDGAASASSSPTNGTTNGNGHTNGTGVEHEYPDVTKKYGEQNGVELQEAKLPEMDIEANAVIDKDNEKAQETAREQKIIDMWNLPHPKTGNYTEHRLQLEEEIASQSMNSKLPNRTDIANNMATFATQFYFLCCRAIYDVIRNPYKLRARLGQALFMGIFCGLCYLDVGHGQKSVQNRRGVLFFVSAGGIMNATMGSLTIFAPEKEVFKREYASKMYSLPAFFVSKFAMELPLRVLMPFIMSCIIYWMVGLQNTASHFFIFAGTVILLDIVGTSLGMLFATIFPSLPIALAASPMVLLPLMLFSGFFLNSNSIPDYFDWISYISPIKWAFMALSRNEFPGLTFDCPPSPEECPFKTGEDVIAQLNFDSQPVLAADEGILLSLATGFFLLAFIALWRTSKRL